METPKRSAHQIWREAKENNLTKEETKKLLVKEGVIVKKSDHNTLYRKVAVSEEPKNTTNKPLNQTNENSYNRPTEKGTAYY